MTGPPPIVADMTNDNTAPIGELASVNGRNLWFHKSGGDGPTVVFLPGASAIGLDYYGLQQEAAKFGTAVIYDRAGTGFSDDAELPRTAEAVAVELHELLTSQGIEGPYVLVAHSLGGAYADRYAQLYPDEVAGLVWVDAFYRDWDDYLPAEASLAAGEEIAPTREQLEGALPFMRDMVATAFADYPDDVREAVVDYHVSERWIDAGIAERSALVPLAAELKAGSALPDVPLIALTPLAVDPGQQALMSEELMQTVHDGKTRLYNDLAGAVTRGENRVLPDLNHTDIVFTGAATVVQAIRDVVDLASGPVVLTDEDKVTIRTAAHGAVMLISFAAVASSPGKAATKGSLALSSATGPVGHALAETSKVKLNAKSGAALADQVFPALTASVSLLKRQDRAEADNFRQVVLVAVEAAAGTQPAPPVAEMVRKITAALDA